MSAKKGTKKPKADTNGEEKEKATKKRRKKISTRRGVSIILAGDRGWRAKWTDPKTGRTKWESLAQHGITDEDGAAGWAENRSKTLLAEKADIAAGIKPTESKGIKEAVKEFLDAKKDEVKPDTHRYYTDLAHKFRDWALSVGIKETQDLGPADLERYRDFVNRSKKAVPAAGEKKGAKKKTAKPLSARRRNALLSGARMLLAKWERLDLLPDHTAVKARDRLRAVRQAKGAPEFMTGPEVETLLRAALAHDVDVHDLTRKEKAEGLKPGEGDTRKHQPIAPFVAAMVLGGFRLSECRMLEWSEVDLDAKEIRLKAAKTKTKRDRTVTLAETPTLVSLLEALKLRRGENKFVFGGAKELPDGVTRAVAKRLTRDYEAPEGWTWLKLRRTCGTHLTCAPSIYGAASAFMSAKRLGHSVTIAEAHYAGALSGISPDAKTLEAALGIEKVMRDTLTASGATVSEEETEARRWGA